MNISQIDRGAVYNERMGRQFRVADGNLVSIDADGVSTFIGEIAGSGQCSLPYSFNTQAVIGGGKYYLFDTTDGFRQVTDPDVGSPIDAVWVDGYYFFTDGEYLYHTNLQEEAKINALRFATSEFSPDPTLGVGLTVDDKVIAFNRYTTEFFQNTANEGFAFTRLPSRNVTAGIVATHAKVRVDGIYYCCGGAKESDITVFALGTGSIVNVASRTVNKILGQYNENQLRGIVMEARTVDNYAFVILHLPNEVLMLNLTLASKIGFEDAWSVLASSSDQLAEIPYRAINGVFDPRRGQWVYGDKFEPSLAYLDSNVATQYGLKVPCEINTPFIYLEAASIDELDIQTIPGFTETSDATVFVSLTYDGLTYGTEASMQYGLPSKYSQRFIARRLGAVQDWFGLKLRWLSKSRMAFSMAKLTFG